MSNIFKVAQPVRVGNFSSAPLDVSAGAIYWDTTASELFVADGSTYVALSSATGTVTSVALSLPSIFSVSGSPVTTSGTLSASLASQTANTFFAAPDGSAGAPTFRTIVAADIPTLNQNTTGTAANITATSNSTLTTLSSLSLPTSQLSGTISLTTQVAGTLPVANGGTGQTTAAAAFNAINPMTTTGDLVYESATNVASRLPIGSAGDVLTVSGGIPAWAPPATSGTVTSVAFSDASTAPIFDVTGSPVTSSGTLTITLAVEAANKVFAGPTTGSDAQPTFRSLVSDDIPDLSATYVTQSEVGAANGVASLDGAGKVPVSQLPNSVMEFQGAWDASSNTPTLADGTGNAGDVYRVSVAGTQDLGSGSETYFVGDFVIYSGSVWQRSPMADGVSSVNGDTGAVTVNAINQLTGDVTAGPASGSQSKAATVAAIQGTTVSGTTGSGNVVFSAAPTLTGLLSGGSASFTSTIAASNFSGSSSGTNTGDVTLANSTNGLTISAQILTMGLSSTSTTGSLTSTDWNTFNGKQDALSFGDLTDAGTDGITVTGGTGAVIGSGTSISQHVADASHNGYLSSTDWSTFNGKISAVVQDTAPALGGDLTLSGFALLGLEKRGASSSAVVQEEYLEFALTASTTAVATSLTNDSKNFKGLSIDYTISNGNDRRTGTIKVAANNATGVASTVVSLTDQSTETADILVSWAAAMNGDNIELSYTTGAGTFHMDADIKRFRS